MAIVIRRYAPVGASDSHLQRFGSTAVVLATHHAAARDYQIDDAIPGAIEDLDYILGLRGFEYAPNAPVAGRMVLSELWAVIDVDDTATNVPMQAQTSTMFDEYKPMRSGSIVGLSTRFVDAIVAGSATIVVTINGTPGTLALLHNSGSNQNGGIATQAPGVDTFDADDLIGVEITTTAGFVMNSAEATLEIEESA